MGCHGPAADLNPGIHRAPSYSDALAVAGAAADHALSAFHLPLGSRMIDFWMADCSGRSLRQPRQLLRRTLLLAAFLSLSIEAAHGWPLPVR